MDGSALRGNPMKEKQSFLGKFDWKCVEYKSALKVTHSASPFADLSPAGDKYSSAPRQKMPYPTWRFVGRDSEGWEKYFLVVSSRFDYLGVFWKTTRRFQNTTKTTFLSTIWWFWRWLVEDEKNECDIGWIEHWSPSRISINNRCRYERSQIMLSPGRGRLFGPIDLWNFWTTYALALPNYFIVACTVAPVPPSSAICERLFARFVMGFDGDQDNSLEDYKSAATIIRLNRSLMKSSGLEPY